MRTTITLADEAESTVFAVSELVLQHGGQVTSHNGNQLTVEPRLPKVNDYELALVIEQSPLVVSRQTLAERAEAERAAKAEQAAERAAERKAQADADAAAQAEADRLASSVADKVATKLAKK
jgi:hypothetical protein